MKSAVVVFPGSNCDRDLAVALELVTGTKPQMIWHKDSSLPERLDFIGIPGRLFLRRLSSFGAVAARSPVMKAVKHAAEREFQ